MSLSDTWSAMLIGGSFAFTALSFVYTWRVEGKAAKGKEASLKAIAEAKKELLDALSRQNETIQKTAGGVMNRADRKIEEVRNEGAVARSEIQREMADHALEDSRTFATKAEMSEAFGELRQELRAISGKLDRVIERNNQVDRP